jgi:predicted nucleotide-binding protein
MPQKRKYEQPPFEIRKFSPLDIQTGINKIRRRIEEVKNLKQNMVRYDDVLAETVQSNIRTAVLEIFGENSPEYREHRYYRIWHGPLIITDTGYDRQEKFEAGIAQTITMLKGLVSRLEEKRDDITPDSSAVPLAKEQILDSNRNVFIVHGQDEVNLPKLERLLHERWNLIPIVLREEPGKGRTLIEKFEQVALMAIYAFAIFTPDDQIEMSGGKYAQARPNAVFELGWFYGKLGRDRVCILFKSGTKIHSDLDGISRIEFNIDVTEKLAQIEKELKAVNLIEVKARNE